MVPVIIINEINFVGKFKAGGIFNNIVVFSILNKRKILRRDFLVKKKGQKRIKIAVTDKKPAG